METETLVLDCVGFPTLFSSCTRAVFWNTVPRAGQKNREASLSNSQVFNCHGYKTIFFDLGNVLLYFDLGKMKSQIAKLSGLSTSVIADAVDQVFEPYEKGQMGTKALHEHFCALAGKELDYAGLRYAVADIFLPNQAAVSLLTPLKEKGVRLFLLSNTCEAHFEFAHAHFPFLHLFDGYVLSYKVGARKPEKEIFLEALNRAQCQNNHCFYIDDIPEYVAAAKELGIDAEVFTSADALADQLRERDLL